MEASYVDALPALALAIRLDSDPSIARLKRLLRLTEVGAREGRLSGFLRGVPPGAGRDVIGSLLLRGANTRRAMPLISLVPFAAFVGPAPQGFKRRLSKRGSEHDKHLSLAISADRIVRAMLAHPEPLPPEPTRSAEADRKAQQRLLQGAAAHILRRGAYRSPAALRRRLSEPRAVEPS